ncbi:hypothetical protein GS610_05475 [Ruegeria sp. HKCCD6228]|uniref:hypothetical protein n=1 Tax=unclassified Ruegeria TaxID=2625375 RepID=UPI00148815E6|nr:MULTISPECIES: hypothetical protein [unclassified Ruegeria]NOD96654.1 hypothetical protein [Ruegeria sp. HKCCD6228]
MQVVHRGFDTIALSIQANISQELFDLLNAERERAEEERHPVPFSYGGADFDLLPHGGNGYRFILKGGPLDVHWSFKKPNARDPWGIRISVGSTLLATQGLGYARSYIDKTLTRLGIRFESHQVSISRADFCVDILAPEFELVPENFVIHSHTNRADYLTAQDDMRSNGKSGQFTSVTVGKMPGRQVIIYDKRREVIDKKKPIWWDIWNTNLEREGLPPLDSSDASQSRVWRIEIRAGKDLLKDRWQIRTWPQFDAMFGDVISEALQKIRYCEPDPDDSNRARWSNHEIWDLVSGSSEDDLQEMRSHIDATNIKHVHRNEQIRLIMTQIAGLGITLAALEDTQESELSDFMESVGGRLAENVQADPERAANKLHEAKNRYRFIA